MNANEAQSGFIEHVDGATTNRYEFLLSNAHIRIGVEKPNEPLQLAHLVRFRILPRKLSSRAVPRTASKRKQFMRAPFRRGRRLYTMQCVAVAYARASLQCMLCFCLRSAFAIWTECKGIRSTRTTSSVQQQLNRRRLFSLEQIVDVYGLFRIFFVFSIFSNCPPLRQSVLHRIVIFFYCWRKTAESTTEINQAIEIWNRLLVPVEICALCESMWANQMDSEWNIELPWVTRIEHK